MSRTRRDDFLRRYRAVDRANPIIDRPRAEAALREHFVAAGYPPFPVRWVSGLHEGRLWSRRADFPSSGPLSSQVRLDPIRRPPVWTFAGERRIGVVDAYPLPRDLLRASWTVIDSILLGLRFDDLDLRDLNLEAYLECPRSAALGGAWTLACGIDRMSIFEPLAKAFEAGLWIYWVFLDEVVALPLPVLRTREGRLHNESGPAVSWPGEEELWFVDGIRMTRDLVMDFHLLRPQQIRAIENVEVRRVLIRRYGEERFLRDAGAEVVGADEIGTLYRLELPGDEPIVMVRVLNSTPEADGTRKPYLLRVPPRMRSAREAVAWTFRLEREAYAPEVET